MELLYNTSGHFVHKFLQIWQNNEKGNQMKKILFCLILGVELLGICWLSFEIPVVYADSEEIDITFVFQDKRFFYNSAKYERSEIFFNNSKLQKRGLSTRSGRANLLKQVLNLEIEPKVALNYCFVGIDEVLDDMKMQIDCEPVDASYTLKNDAPHFVFTREKIGYKLDFLQIANQIYEKLCESNVFTISLTPTKLLPAVCYDDIKDYQNLRAQFSTYFLQNENREHNINLALSAFNKLKLIPNREYSFNEITGSREEACGYKEAKIIVGGKYVEGVGGGVCQVSTTIYNALLLAGVDVTEVHNHTLSSSYVKLGFDAMVNYGTADLKWQNNFDFPLFMFTKIENNQINVSIYGKSDKVSYERVCEIEETFPPLEDEIIVDTDGQYQALVEFDDEEEYIQLPHKGYKVRAILERYEDGKLVERKLLRRVRYLPCGGVKVVGIKKREDNHMSLNNYY